MKLTRQDFVHSIPGEPSNALGALAGTAIGGSGNSAAAGAGLGAALGAIAGTGAGAQSAHTVQGRYDIGYQQCMYAKIGG